jgi:hypothetical protein
VQALSAREAAPAGLDAEERGWVVGGGHGRAFLAEQGRGREALRVVLLVGAMARCAQAAGPAAVPLLQQQVAGQGPPAMRAALQSWRALLRLLVASDGQRPARGQAAARDACGGAVRHALWQETVGTLLLLALHQQPSPELRGGGRFAAADALRRLHAPRPAEPHDEPAGTGAPAHTPAPRAGDADARDAEVLALAAAEALGGARGAAAGHAGGAAAGGERMLALARLLRSLAARAPLNVPR